MEEFYNESFGQVLDTTCMGRDYEYFSTIDSTNTYMKGFVEAAHGKLIFAEEQTAGKGTHGRRWISDKKNGIWATLMLTKKPAEHSYSQITLLLAFSIIEVLKQSYDIEAELKWPNDIYLNSHKLAGILMEVIKDGPTEEYVIGFGLNVNAENFDSDIQHIATSLCYETGKKYDRGVLLASICKKFEENYDQFCEQGRSYYKTVQQQIGTCLLDKGEYIKIVKGTKEEVVLVVDIDELGYLIVMDKEGRTRVENNGEMHRIGRVGSEKETI